MGIRAAMAVVAGRCLWIRSNCSLPWASRALVVASLGMIAAAGSVVAAPSTGEAAACPIGRWADYIALGPNGTCTIDDKTFSNFGYGAGAFRAPLKSASDVTVIPILTPGNPGFIFSSPSPWTAMTLPDSLAAEYTKSFMQFDVQTTSGDRLIKDASLTSDYVLSGSGVAGAKELICLGASPAFPNPCPSGSPVSLDASSDTNSNGDFQSFTTQSLVGVNYVEIIASADAGGNTAIASSATVQFSEVPESATVALFGTGLLGLVGPRFLRRRSPVKRASSARPPRG